MNNYDDHGAGDAMLSELVLAQTKVLLTLSDKLDKVVEQTKPQPVQMPTEAHSDLIRRMRSDGVHLEDLLDAFGWDGESLATTLNCLGFLGIGTAQPLMPDEDKAVWDGAFVWQEITFPTGYTETHMLYSGNAAAGGPESGHREMILTMFDTIELY